MMSVWKSGIAGVVTLPNGWVVRGRGLYAGTPSGDLAPDYALYLTGARHEEAGWESRWVRWPDFGLPHSTAEATDAIRETFQRLQDSKVEIACTGGHGPYGHGDGDARPAGWCAWRGRGRLGARELPPPRCGNVAATALGAPHATVTDSVTAP